MLDFYNENRWLPNGVTIEIVDYEDDKGARYERNGQIVGEREGSTSTSEVESEEDSDSESITSCSETDEDGFEVVSGEEKTNVEAAEFETWTCFFHFKKFQIKFVLNEDIVKTVKKIMTEESSIER